jgi:hypothetical protein
MRNAVSAICFAIVFPTVLTLSSFAHALNRSNCDTTLAEIGGEIVGGLAGAADAMVGQTYGNSVCVNPYNGMRYACYNPHVAAARTNYIAKNVSEATAELICSMTEKDHDEWENARNRVLQNEKQAQFDASYDHSSKVVGSVEVLRTYRQSGQLCKDVRTFLYKRSDQSESGSIDEKYCVNSDNRWELVKE